MVLGVRKQITENRGQRTNGKNLRMKHLVCPLTSDLCNLTSVICPLTSDL